MYIYRRPRPLGISRHRNLRRRPDIPGVLLRTCYCCCSASPRQRESSSSSSLYIYTLSRPSFFPFAIQVIQWYLLLLLLLLLHWARGTLIFYMPLLPVVFTASDEGCPRDGMANREREREGESVSDCAS